nr:hypothetical protein [Actinomadura sp. CNU-125]
MLWIAITPPGRMPASRPSGPRTTSSTPASSTTQTQAMSTAAPSSAGDAAVPAPVSANGSTVCGRRAHSVVGRPASTIRRAIGPPWLPRPMNPTRSGVGALT